MWSPTTSPPRSACMPISSASRAARACPRGRARAASSRARAFCAASASRRAVPLGASTFAAVVRLDDLDVPVRPRAAAARRDELREDVDADAHVRLPEHGHPRRRRARARRAPRRRAPSCRSRARVPGGRGDAARGRASRAGAEKSTTTSARACSRAARPSTTHVPVRPDARELARVAPDVGRADGAHELDRRPRARGARRRGPCGRSPRRRRGAPHATRLRVRLERRGDRLARRPREHGASGPRTTSRHDPSHRERRLHRRRVRLEEHRLVHRQERQVRAPRLVATSRRARVGVARDTSAGSTLDVTLMTPRAPIAHHRQRERVVAARAPSSASPSSARSSARAARCPSPPSSPRRSAPPRRCARASRAARSTPVRPGML